MNIFSFIANAGGGMDLSSGGNAAFQGGYQIGYFVGIALAFLAPGFAVRSLFRRQVNKKCALSMVFLLAAFAIASLVGPFNEATSPALKVMTGALDMVAVLVSAILAIIGLVEFRESGARFGRKRAIVSLIICGFLLLAFIGGVQRGMRNRGFGGNPQAKPASFERTDLNFRIDYGPPWVSIKPLQAENQLMLTSGVPQMFFAMVAEQVGVESSVDTKAIMDIVKARDPNAVAHDECPMTINGVDGIRFQLDATVKGYVLFYDYWVAARDGYAYQLYGWTAPANKLALQRETAKLFEAFRLIDPHRQAHAAGVSSAKDYSSPISGFSAKLAGTPWNIYPAKDLAQKCPAAEFSVYSNKLQFLVLPVPLGKLEVDDDALAEAFADYFGLEVTADSLQVYPVKHGPLTGSLIAFEVNTATGVVRYAGEVLRGNGFAYFLACCGKFKAGDTRTEDVIRDVIARVEFDQSAGQPHVDEFTSRERLARARI